MSDRNRDSQESLSAGDQPRTPTLGELGLITSDRSHVARQTQWAWQSFAELLGEIAEADNFDTPLRSTDSRGRRQTIRDIAIGIGSWPGARTVTEIVEDAQAGLHGDLDQDSVIEALRAEHRHAPTAEVLAQVTASVAGIERFCADIADAECTAAQVADAPVRSLLGTLPVLTLLHAATYQLAVYSLDIAAAGPGLPALPKGLTHAGVEALVDVTGAIAARQQLGAAIAARTPEGVVATRSLGPTVDASVGQTTAAFPGSWHTVRLPAGASVDAPSVTASSRTFIEVTTGRVGNIPALMLKRELVLDDIPGLLHITPVLEGVPGLPGGAALRTATASVRAVAGIGSGITGRLSRFARRS